MVGATVEGLYWVLGAGCLFAVLSLTRFAVNLGVLDRPLFASLVWGAATGHWDSAFGVGVFFELLWLDHFPAGTHIPPNALYATLFSLCLMELFSLREPSLGAPVLLLSVPFALLAMRVEAMERMRRDVAFNMLLRWVRKPGQGRVLTRHMLRSLLRHLVVGFIIFVPAVVGVALVLAFFDPPNLFSRIQPPLTWGHCWFGAAIGGILSLRLSRQRMIFGGTVAALAVLAFMGVFP